MIVYRKTWWACSISTRLYGSAIPRSIVGSLVSLVVCFILHCNDEAVRQAEWRHPYPYQVFAFVVGFAVTYRCNYSYLRYMEGRTHLQQLTDRAAEAAITFFEFDNIQNPDADGLDQHRTFQAQLLHLVSLWHALGLQHLRRDWNLRNLVPHRPHSRSPPVDAKHIFTPEHYVAVSAAHGVGLPEEESIKFFWKHVHHGFLRAFRMGADVKSQYQYFWLNPLPVLGGILSDEWYLLDTENEKYQGRGAVVGPCPVRAPSDEALNVFMPSSVSGPGGSMPSRLVGYIGPAFVPQATMDVRTSFEFGYAPPPDARFHIVYSWIINLTVKRFNSGGLQMPHPILSRPFQLLSEAMNGFSQARKLAETPFPFPIAQLITLLLYCLTLTAPLMINAYITALWLQMLVTFLAVSTYWALNEVARDLEDPYVYDPNDLPLSYIQHTFNECLQAAVYGRRPDMKAMTVSSTESVWGPKFTDAAIQPFGSVGSFPAPAGLHTHPGDQGDNTGADQAADDSLRNPFLRVER